MSGTPAPMVGGGLHAAPGPRIVGIDPGCGGALALLVAGRLASVQDMPFVKVRRGKSDKAEVEGLELTRMLRAMAPEVVVIELVGGVTGQSASAAFNFGRAAGAPEYIAKALGYRVERVAPAAWKRALQLNSGKDGSRAMAMAMWPLLSHRFIRKMDDGRAEAALVAHWFHLQQPSATPPA